MMAVACLATLLNSPDVVIVDTKGDAIVRSADFAVGKSPYATGGEYLWAKARGGKPGAIRVAAPSGEFYVYLAWMRHPNGAREVVVRVGGVEVKVDQSRLANGVPPDDYPLDEMQDYKGVCSSGLFRLMDKPIRLGKGDVVEIIRSDSKPGTITSMDAVVFSKRLFLDDLGNDAAWTGRPTVNLRSRGTESSGRIGMGLAFIKPGAPGTNIEWTVPVDGLFLLAANPNRGPSRAKAFPLEIEFPDGAEKTLPVKGWASSFVFRDGWQVLAAIDARCGTKLRIRSAEKGVVCADLLRLTPLGRDDLAGATERRVDTFIIQWAQEGDRLTWLRDLKIIPVDNDAIEFVPLKPGGPLPNGMQVNVPHRRAELLGAGKDAGAVLLPGEATIRLEGRGGYGVTLATELLRREGFVWLKDLGVFASSRGDFLSNGAKIDAMAAQVEAARGQPFRSTSEKYYELTGYHEDQARGLDNRAFRFAYDTSRPLAPRVGESIAQMPEVDYAYFVDRIEDPRHRRMFLGWASICNEFYVLSNGAIGTSPRAVKGTGHSQTEHFTVQMGVGEGPTFKEHGDRSVRQRLEDDYHIIVHTEWEAAGAKVRATALAYPMAGEAVKTGNEPLAAFVRMVRCGSTRAPFWLKIRPDRYDPSRKPIEKPVTDLGRAAIANGRLMAGDRIVLAIKDGTATIASAADDEVLVEVQPAADRVELVIPYVKVGAALLDASLALGFDGAMAATKRYWDTRLAKGAIVDVPDPIVSNMYKTLYPRVLVCGDLDVDGNYALKTSPIIYDTLWIVSTALGSEALARRGHFDDAKQYLSALLAWQGSQASDAKGFTSWKGFFNAPPRYEVPRWLNFHGWAQWAIARYFLFSDDREWLTATLPNLIDSLEWTRSQRRPTMKSDPDGTKPVNYGWLPGGRVTDGSHGTSTFTDCVNWAGFNEVVRLLERIEHPRAAEFRKEADDYRRWIVRGLRLAASRRPLCRLNDGTYVPYVPGYLESTGREESMWYAAVVDGALEGVLDSGCLTAGEPIEDWLVANLEDNLFVIAPNLADEAYYVGHGLNYIRRDQPKRAIYTFYSLIASNMTRQTLTTFEHRSWGRQRIYELTPWAMGQYVRMLSGMLCYDENDELVYCKATPKAWLDPGKTIRVERLQTRFGPTSFTLEGRKDEVVGQFDVPTRQRPAEVKIRIRVNGKVTSVALNGREVAFDDAGTVTVPAGADRVELAAKVDRRR